MLGLNQSLMSLAQVVAPPLGGCLIGTASARMGFCCRLAAGIGLIAKRWGSRARRSCGRLSKIAPTPNRAEIRSAGLRARSARIARRSPMKHFSAVLRTASGPEARAPPKYGNGAPL